MAISAEPPASRTSASTRTTLSFHFVDQAENVGVRRIHSLAAQNSNAAASRLLTTAARQSMEVSVDKNVGPRHSQQYWYEAHKVIIRSAASQREEQGSPLLSSFISDHSRPFRMVVCALCSKMSQREAITPSFRSLRLFQYNGG